MSRKRKRSFLGKPDKGGFAGASGAAGHFAVIGQRDKALSLIKESLSKYKGRAQQYYLLCQGGDCLLAMGKVDDATKVFSEALEAAYEPAAGRARIGLAKCLLAKGEHGRAEDEISRAIDEAGKAAKEGYSRDGEGEWTLLAVPVCPQAIAMRIFPSFNKTGQGRVGRKLLSRAKERAVGEPYRLGVFMAKVDERRGRKEEAVKSYDASLSGAVLGPRALPALGGWCRCSRTVDGGTLRQKLSCFRGKLLDRAVLTAVLNLRGRGAAEWVETSKAKLDGRDRVAVGAVLPLRIMALGNRKKWDEMLAAAEELLATRGLTAQEGAGAVAAAVEARWMREGAAGDIEGLARRAPDAAKARWAGYRRLLHLGDGEGCELFFKSMGRGEAARSSLGEALLLQGRRDEAREIFTRLAKAEAPARCRTAALVSLLDTLTPSEEMPPEIGALVRGHADDLERVGGISGVADLAGLVVGLRRGGAGKALAEEMLARTRNAFRASFFTVTEPRSAVNALNSVNAAISSFGGKGGVRDLYLTAAQGCLPMLALGGGGFHRYMVSVYGDTYSLGLVSEADRLWTEVKGLGPVPPRWKAARLLVEAEIRAGNRQASGIDLARASYSAFGTGEFAARACYLLALNGMGMGRSPGGWAAAGLDALGRSRTEAGNLGLVARLEVLGSGVNRQKLGRLELKWRRRMSFRRVAERVVRDLSRVESPTSS